MNKGGRPKEHGLSRDHIYMIWRSMIRRCTVPSARDYPRYGGRGIKVCDRWQTVWLFIFDMGPRPDGYSLERIGNDGNYEPSNCKWASPTEQQNNKRNNHYIEYHGERMSIADAVRRSGSGISRETARNRISRGWGTERAIDTPNTFRRAPDRKVIRIEEQP